MPANTTCDSTIIVRGLVHPRRKKRDKIYREQLRLHKKAKKILKKVESGEYRLHIPLIAFIETASVVSRLTNDKESIRMALSFLGENSKVYPDILLFEKAVEIGIETKASGFDVLFMACAKLTKSKLITDDRRQFERAKEYGLETEFLRSEEESKAGDPASREKS